MPAGPFWWQVRVLVERARQVADRHKAAGVVLVGDFNSTPVVRTRTAPHNPYQAAIITAAISTVADGHGFLLGGGGGRVRCTNS